MLFLQGLIFVVDSNDRERAQEAAEELQKMVSETHLNITIFKCPLFLDFTPTVGSLSTDD